jgi:tight adherence protein B
MGERGMVIGAVAALLAGYGAFLVYTAVACGWRGLGPRTLEGPRPVRRSVRLRLDAAGLRNVDPMQLGAAMVVLSVIGAAGAFALFGGVLPALVTAGFAASFPLAGFRARYRRQLEASQGAWPRMLEELRLLTGSVGRSIPQALFEVGRRAPAELRPAFAVAEREWLLTMDFNRTAAVLKEQLADPTADVVCETLVVAHEVGGGGIDRRLAELIEDRILDAQGRPAVRAPRPVGYGPRRSLDRHRSVRLRGPLGAVGRRRRDRRRHRLLGLVRAPHAGSG